MERGRNKKIPSPSLGLSPDRPIPPRGREDVPSGNQSRAWAGRGERRPKPVKLDGYGRGTDWGNGGELNTLLLPV